MILEHIDAALAMIPAIPPGPGNYHLRKLRDQLLAARQTVINIERRMTE
jgi:hypothetical protein